MNMIFKRCHHMIFVKLWYPMNNWRQLTGWISVKSFTNTVDWNMIIDELYFIFIGFKRVNHKLLLVAIKFMHVTWVQSNIMDIAKCEIQENSSVLNWWNFLNKLIIIMFLEMLWKIDMKSGSIVINCNICTWKLIYPDIMISYTCNHRH